MARLATGLSSLEAAKKQLREARTVDELRSAQAVILPLELGLSMEQTGEVIGISTGWACRLRRRFIRQNEHPEVDKAKRTKPGSGRGRAYLGEEEEKAFLLPFVKKSTEGGLLIVSEIRQALNKKLNRETAIATVYNLLHRHGWRKLSPDKRHPKSDDQKQQDWKKNFLNSCKM